MFKKKAKVVLKEKSIDEKGLTCISNDCGDANVCVTMAISYLADMIATKQADMGEVTKILKKLTKEYEEGEDTKWL